MLTRIVENISRGKSCAMSGASSRRRARGLTSAETSLQNSTTRACARQTGQRVKKFGLRHRGDTGAQGHPLCDRGARGAWVFVQKWPAVCEARLARDHLLRVEDGLASSCPVRALALLCDIGGELFVATSSRCSGQAEKFGHVATSSRCIGSLAGIGAHPGRRRRPQRASAPGLERSPTCLPYHHLARAHQALTHSRCSLPLHLRPESHIPPRRASISAGLRHTHARYAPPVLFCGASAPPPSVASALFEASPCGVPRSPRGARTWHTSFAFRADFAEL